MILNIPEIFQNWTSTQFNQICYIKAWVLVRIHWVRYFGNILEYANNLERHPLTSEYLSSPSEEVSILYSLLTEDVILCWKGIIILWNSIFRATSLFEAHCWINKICFHKVIKIAYVTDLERRITYISKYRNLVQNVIKNLMGIFSVRVNIIFKQVGFFFLHMHSADNYLLFVWETMWLKQTWNE